MNTHLTEKFFDDNYRNSMLLPIDSYSSDPDLVPFTSKYTSSFWDKNDYINEHINIEQHAYREKGHTIGALEKQLQQQRDGNLGAIRPIIHYVAVLKEMRKKSQSIASFHDEISFAHWAKDKLNDLAATLGLPADHFSIDIRGEPLLIKEGRGEHVISPTHFENGAYLSHPHPDHQLDMAAHDIPQIKIGRYARFGRNVSVNAGGNITIGDGVWLSPGSCLLRQDHDPYGRPSIASRTVAMTRQPPIQLADFAWVGREAMVGWDADYIGKFAIVATRSFLNSWVGDYSITGSYGKIIQYMPYKAAILEALQPSLEDILQISDWEKINTHWLTAYAALELEQKKLPSVISDKLKTLLALLPSKKSKVLDMHPERGELLSLAASKNIWADSVFVADSAVAIILQRVQNTGNYTVRLKTADPWGLNLKLPLADSVTNVFTGRSSGYDLVVNNNVRKISTHELNQLLAEAARVSNKNGKIFFSTKAACDYHELIAYSKQIPLSLHDQGVDRNTQQHYVVFSKL
jgi:acetyltransferase-like isoleucine patch superfamily enzyme